MRRPAHRFHAHAPAAAPADIGSADVATATATATATGTSADGDDGIGSRCAGCRLARAACLCALVPRLDLATRIVLVLHRLEDRKTSNSGRLALRCLANSAVVMRGDRHPEPPPPWDERGEPVLLFPHADARPLESWRGSARPVTLIVPDGTWRQAARVRRRVPGLADLPCARLTPSGPSRYRLRTTPHAGRLATLEAIAEALGVLEGPGPREALLRIFDVMVERTLQARGKLPRLNPAS